MTARVEFVARETGEVIDSCEAESIEQAREWVEEANKVLDALPVYARAVESAEGDQ